jgi:hypothetical protein
MLDLARERSLVEALRVALGADLERRRDVDLDERGALLDERAGAAARLLVGEIAQTTTAAPARARREATQPMRAMLMSRSPSSSRGPAEMRAHDVAVQHVDGQTAVPELGRRACRRSSCRPPRGR